MWVILWLFMWLMCGVPQLETWNAWLIGLLVCAFADVVRKAHA